MGQDDGSLPKVLHTSQPKVEFGSGACVHSLWLPQTFLSYGSTAGVLRRYLRPQRSNSISSKAARIRTQWQWGKKAHYSTRRTCYLRYIHRELDGTLRTGGCTAQC